MRAARLVPVLVLLACSAIAAATMQDGLDYFGDGSAAVDALARLDLPAFFASQPLMGPLSVVLRAPVAALVFHQSLTVVYFAGVVPCLALFAAFAVWLRRVARRRGASDEQLLAAALLTLGSPLVLRAILLAVLAVAAWLSRDLFARRRPVAAADRAAPLVA